jgi:hypothetical protein
MSEKATETNGHVDIHVERGNPSDEDVAALVAVLGGVSSGVPEAIVPPRNMWGHPVGRLRYAACSWERVTLLERTYMRR